MKNTIFVLALLTVSVAYAAQEIAPTDAEPIGAPSGAAPMFLETPSSPPQEKQKVQEKKRTVEQSAPVAAPVDPGEEPPAPQEWRGDSSGITDFTTSVATNEDDWRQLWRSHISYQYDADLTPPAVDFEKSMVVGVFLGNRGTGGYAVNIVEIRKAAGKKTVVYHEDVPSPRDHALAVITQPFHLKVIPTTSSTIEFKKQ